MFTIAQMSDSRAFSLSLTAVIVVIALAWWRRPKQEGKRLVGPQPEEKIAYFVRHGEAWHNAKTDYSIPDPDLTPKGEEQAFSLRSNPQLVAALSSDKGFRAQLLVVSPLRRTLQTAAVGFGDLQPQLPWLIEPDIQEKNSVPCDTGAPDLGAAFLAQLGRPDLQKQYESLPEGWHRKEGAYAPDVKLLRARFQRFTDRLRDRPEKIFIVVAHDHVLSAGLNLQKRFANCEVRPYAMTPRGVWRELPRDGSWFRE
mmetsp:Transcript_123601/g.344118  ORF Transcript_123601/g.344118 Transcript_123601/m.344118 type:complete len:255 (+) Transcript_123601:48-812(+)